MENPGKAVVPCELIRREHRHPNGNVSLPAEDEALVFCGGNAAYSYHSGGHSCVFVYFWKISCFWLEFLKAESYNNQNVL